VPVNAELANRDTRSAARPANGTVDYILTGESGHPQPATGARDLRCIGCRQGE